MRELTKCLKAVANERRLKIIQNLERYEPLTVSDIAARIGLSLKSTSKHVQKLVDCDLVERTQKSLEVWCRLNHKHYILRSLLSHLH
ncbi:MAG: winged helix-turn-helix transcriptional regulator [Candidatus Kerfeldbacteria bacterium]|nr:winged helix-turn-helix transcriptional regulator [Candidatus Kerfeldbacteria bacterium]